MANPDVATAAEAWLSLWNGDLSLLTDLVEDDVVAHVVSPDGARLETVEGLAPLGDLIRQVHACFSERTV